MNILPLYGFGGGGSQLNFKVVAYATAEERAAATPAENTLGVITNTPITAWSFSSAVPDTPISGMVHFITASTSSVEFNALKKNEITVYPSGCSQYVNGCWVVRDAMLYKNGAWQSWKLVLYSNGTFSDIGGKMIQTGVKSTGSAGSCTLTIGAANVKIGTLGGKAALAHFPNQVDLTPYKTLYFTGSVVDKNTSSSYEKCGIGVWKNIPNDAASEASAIMEGFRAMGTHTLDISNCTGPHYVGIAVSGFGEATNPYLETTMQEMILE